MRSWFEKLRRGRSPPRPVKPLARYRYVRLRWRVLFALIDCLGHIAARLAGERGGVSPPVRNLRSILIVQLDHLGDAILSTGLLRGLKAAYPEARIDVLASPSNAELFECLPDVNRVFVSHVTRFSGGGLLGWIWSTIGWGWRLRNAYDLAIDPRGDFPSAVILRLCGAPVRLGWGCGGGGFLLTHQAEFVWGRHEVLSRQALLDQLDIAPPADDVAWPPRFVPTRAAHELLSLRLLAERVATKHSPRRGIAGQPRATPWVKGPERMHPNGVRPATRRDVPAAPFQGASGSNHPIPRALPWAALLEPLWGDGEHSPSSSPTSDVPLTSPLVVLHVGAGTHAKRWPAKQWQELIGRLILAHDPCIVLVGSAADGELVNAMPGVRNWCGKLSIDELAALIERADLLIGGDSGPAHLAAAVGTPAVVIFSGTNRAEQWQPWGSRVRVVKHPAPCSPCHRAHCPLKDHPCMSGLQPLAVLAAARELLSTPALQRTSV